SGCNDITAAEILDPASRSPAFQYTRVTTSSMPNLVTSNNPLEAGFPGDQHVARPRQSEGRALLAWADTRQHAGTAPEEDVYYARVPALSGPALPPPSRPHPPPQPPQPPNPPPPPSPRPPPAVCSHVARVHGLGFAVPR